MSKPGLSLGRLTLSKKPTSKPTPARRRPVFGGDSDDDDATGTGAAEGEKVAELGGLDLLSAPAQTRATEEDEGKKKKKKNALVTEPPKLAKKKDNPPMMFGDLAGSLTSRKNAEEGEKTDKSIYEYDAVYESIRPKKKVVEEVGEGGEKKSRYMGGLMAASSVRKRDQQIAEEKKIARDREAEGEEFADKEKFVTAAYRKQQEENRLAAEEEKRREEAEGKSNVQGGMSGFYRKLLDREDKDRAEMIKEAEEKAAAVAAGQGEQQEGEGGEEKEKTDADVARELKEKGISVAVNEDGQIVDRRQLLQGGLNVVAPKKAEPSRKQQGGDRSSSQREQDWRGQGGRGFVGAGGGKRAMVERQSRMMEEQLAESLKRSRDAEEEEKAKMAEKLARSKKTEADISSAKERYLARKREAEEAKKLGGAV
ncbi:uncharacterized protein DNG_03856 [Cephalotrichum gorgonifer]|uniref:Nuclear speckle splicing regulatory protein 1 N-terminal domain-containing protein n=1 Tax=Cephalotrichum gorgonifer TaxID=2041049 RepID=A0AAE8SUD2_9PEZI|nr:uncharacterized protein DNG_03856 [Cephalotrichum gorgonifer]